MTTREEAFDDSPLPCCNDDGTHEPYCDVAIYAEEQRIQAELTSLRAKLARAVEALRTVRPHDHAHTPMCGSMADLECRCTFGVQRERIDAALLDIEGGE